MTLEGVGVGDGFGVETEARARVRIHSGPGPGLGWVVVRARSWVMPIVRIRDRALIRAWARVHG